MICGSFLSCVYTHERHNVGDPNDNCDNHTWFKVSSGQTCGGQELL